MITTVINVDVFEQPYRSGLLFSLFEGLKEGEGFKVVSKDNLEDMKNQFMIAQIRNIKLEESETNQNLCEMEVKKVNHHEGGCCGMCGS